MCSRIFHDREGKVPFEGEVKCKEIIHEKGRESRLGKEIVANINPKGMNARVESIPTVWINKNMLYVQTVERINAFMEGDELFFLPDDVDIMCLVADWDGRRELKIITRPDGISYRQINGNWPDFTSEEIAKKEHSIHKRWPVYQRRIDDT